MNKYEQVLSIFVHLSSTKGELLLVCFREGQQERGRERERILSRLYPGQKLNLIAL